MTGVCCCCEHKEKDIVQQRGDVMQQALITPSMVKNAAGECSETCDEVIETGKRPGKDAESGEASEGGTVERRALYKMARVKSRLSHTDCEGKN